MNLREYKERLDFEIGLEEEKQTNAPEIPKDILKTFSKLWTWEYTDGFIDGLKRAEELTNPRN